MAPRRVIFVFSQHQIASILATGVDYSIMILCVSVCGLSPVVGTVLGASCGAVTSFTLGRHWVFRAGAGELRGQALRYALVSLVSLLANAAGESVVVHTGAQYVVARVAVSIVVGMAWNFPLHRYFVFRSPPADESLPPVRDPVAPAEDAPVTLDDARRRAAPHQTSS
jgi:putative flippase GtrA